MFTNSRVIVYGCLILSVCFTSASLAETWEERKQRLKVSDKAKTEIAAAVPEKLTANPKKARRILVFYRCGGFIHGSIPHANESIQAMSKKTGAFEVDLADTYDVFTEENLAKYDAILLNNTCSSNA